MRKRFIAALLSILFLMMLLPAPAAHAEDSFDVSKLHERYCILVDANDPTTALYGIEKNADVQCSTGSTIKILTCMLAIESGKLEDVATVSEKAVNFNKKYNSLMGLEQGEKWKIEDLLYGLMLPSGNDAAIVIAEHLAGSTTAFAKLMNEKAQELGMTHSHFTTVHGKDDGGKNYSTARDMAILTAWALENETFRTIVKTPTYPCADVSGRHVINLQNTNRLLINAVDETYDPISCLYEGAIGVKTGDTNLAGKCFIAAASRGGVTLIAVLLGGTLDDPDYLARSANMNAKTKDPYNAQRFQDAIELFDYGFRQMSGMVTVKELKDMGLPVSFTVTIPNAAKNDPGNGVLTLSPRLDDTMQIQLMKPYMDELKTNISAIAYPVIGMAVAPINKDDVLGTVEYRVGNSVLFKSNLYADRDVKEGILNEDASPVVVSTDQQPSVSAGAPLMGSASTLSGEPVKESNVKRVILIILLVLFVLVLMAFVAFLIVARIRRERRRRARAAARRRKRQQQERIARQRAAEQDRQR